MNLLELLKKHWEFWGLTAPSFAWCAAGVLIAGTTFALIYLGWRVRTESRTLSKASKAINELKARYPREPKRGLSGVMYEGLAQIFLSLPTLSPVWNVYSTVLIVRRNNSGEEEYWASERASAVFTEEATLGRGLNRNFFTAIPGIVTGIGLLVTFLSILVALYEVRIQNNQVEGLDVLIGGLSGKFISSIAALFAATVFLFAEKPLLYHLTKSRLRLIAAIDSFVPQLSVACLLAELQRDTTEQSVAFRSFNADLSIKLKQSFSESMGPTLHRMVDAIDGLNQLMRSAEANKQESITSSLETMLQNLALSINASLEGIGNSFKESLSGSAKDEFGKVTESLGGTVRLLENMNVQSQMTQSALNDLVKLAKTSTVEQMALGKSQVEDLTAVLRQFMIQINDSAGSSVTRMAATLTNVVHDLSANVTELQKQMTISMEENTTKATSAAAIVVDQASNWSAKSSQQLEDLIKQHQDHLNNVKEVEAALLSALSLFNDSLMQYASLNGDLRKTASEVNANAAAAAGTTRDMQEAQKAVQQVAAYSISQIHGLGEANKAQEEVWKAIQRNMEHYKDIFAQTENASRGLLTQITQNLSSHIDLTKRGYDQLVKAADEHFTAATQRLAASVNELDEILQDLTESIEKIKK